MANPDGSVIIDTKINTDGVDDGSKEIKKKMSQTADAAEGCADNIEKSFESAAKESADAFDAQSQRISEILSDTESSAKSKAAKIASEFKKSGDDQSEAFKKAWKIVNESSEKGSQSVIDDLDDIGEQAKKTGKNVESILAGFVGGIASGVTQKGMEALGNAADAVVEFGKEALQVGSDLQEVQNVVDVTFSTMSDKVNEFAKSADASAGLSETMAKEYAGTFGTMAKSMGFAEAEAYELATALTQFTGDLASFRNLSQDEAFTKLQAIFTGETESLKALGVVMTQTNLDAFALANGFGKTTDAMTEQEKVSLRYQYVMDQLSAAQGDFVRTQDSWANQTKTLELQMENLKTTVGEGLIGALSGTVQFINETTLPSLQALAETFANMFKATPADDFRAAMGDVQSAIDEANAEYNHMAAETQLAASYAEAYASSLEELQYQGLDTAESMSKAKALVAELNKLVPDLNLEINEQNGLLSKNNKEIQNSISNMKKKGMDEATIKRLTVAQEKQTQATKALLEYEGQLAVLEAEQKERREQLAEITDGYSEKSNNLAENLSTVNDYLTTGNLTVQQSSNLYGDLGAEIEQADREIAALKKSMAESSAVIDENQKIIDEWAAEAVEAGLEVSEAMDGAAEATKGAMEEIAGSAAKGTSGALSGTSDTVVGVLDELSLKTDKTYSQLTQGLENNAAVVNKHIENLSSLIASGAPDELIRQFTNTNNATMAALNEAAMASNGQFTELTQNFNAYQRAVEDLEQTIDAWEHTAALTQATAKKSVDEVWAEYMKQSEDWVASRAKLINSEADKAKSEARKLVNEAEKMADEASEYFAKSFKAKEEGNLALADKYRQMAVQKQKEAHDLLAEAQRLFGTEGTAGIVEEAMERVDNASKTLSDSVSKVEDEFSESTQSMSDKIEDVAKFLEDKTDFSADYILEQMGFVEASVEKTADSAVDHLLNAFQEIQDSINGIEGKTVYINLVTREVSTDFSPGAALHTLSTVAPVIAGGTIIPPKAPYSGIQGIVQDRGSGGESLSESHIRQIMFDALGENSGGDISISFNGDLAGLASVLTPVITREQRRNSRAGGY